MAARAGVTCAILAFNEEESLEAAVREGVGELCTTRSVFATSDGTSATAPRNLTCSDDRPRSNAFVFNLCAVGLSAREPASSSTGESLAPKCRSTSGHASSSVS